MSMKNFKVLILYPNGQLMNPPPISIGLFTALLKENGFEVEIFDTTLYPEDDVKSSGESMQENLQVRPFDYSSRSINLKNNKMEVDLVNKIEDFGPGLIAISILECSYLKSVSMLKRIEHLNIPIIAGGVFPTNAPKIVLSNKNIDMVCIGEGEEALIEVCKLLASNKDCSRVEGLQFKKNGEIKKNSIRKPININNLPNPDYSLFEMERFFRPMAGKIYKTIPMETNRGCPYLCSYCNSPSMYKLYKEKKMNFFRKKTTFKIHDELKYLIKKWNAEYIYFTSDNFLMMSDIEFDDFIEIYKDFKLPFWIQSRPEEIRENRINKLKEVGLHRMSIGLEHGNQEFRRKILKKSFDNETMIKASKIIARYEVPLTVNNIIGFPGETRELIFDTIELNRNLVFDTTNCFAYTPFHGTPLHKECVEKGYISEDATFGSVDVDVPLDMPQLPRKEVRGLKRTFALYSRLPKKYWSKIKRAEKFDDIGNQIFSELGQIYQEKYFN
jgi:radical SAM superfamily enzyme YgiQ (UPF0313 family)